MRRAIFLRRSVKCGAPERGEREEAGLGASGMPGCLSYVVAQDSKDADALWVTEVWDSEASHRASLSLAHVKDAISRGRLLIAGIDQSVETVPVGGAGMRGIT